MREKIKKLVSKNAPYIFFLAAIAVFVAITQAAGIVIVSGDSMFPTLRSGDIIRTSRDVGSIERGDIIVAKSSDGTVIKRVVGLPGEDVQISDDAIYINGVPIKDYVNVPTMPNGMPKEGVTLNEREYFVMGDNREHSKDSREFGAVKKEDIKGVYINILFHSH